MRSRVQCPYSLDVGEAGDKMYYIISINDKKINYSSVGVGVSEGLGRGPGVNVFVGVGVFVYVCVGVGVCGAVMVGVGVCAVVLVRVGECIGGLVEVKRAEPFGKIISREQR